jgi:hypothetical protein
VVILDPSLKNYSKNFKSFFEMSGADGNLDATRQRTERTFVANSRLSEAARFEERVYVRPLVLAINWIHYINF